MNEVEASQPDLSIDSKSQPTDIFLPIKETDKGQKNKEEVVVKEEEPPTSNRKRFFIGSSIVILILLTAFLIYLVPQRSSYQSSEVDNLKSKTPRVQILASKQPLYLRTYGYSAIL